MVGGQCMVPCIPTKQKRQQSAGACWSYRNVFLEVGLGLPSASCLKKSTEQESEAACGNSRGPNLGESVYYINNRSQMCVYYGM